MIGFDIVTVVTLVGIWVAVTFGALIYYRTNRIREYDKKNNKASLEMLRESYESKMYSLMDRLVRNEERWKDVNHLVISAQQKELSPYHKHDSSLTEFMKANGVTKEDTKLEKDLVFVLTPFHSRYDKSFSVVSEVCREVGLRCMRGDEEHIVGDLLPHTLKLMARARLVIANVDGRNPNVFYELGVAHATDKGTIIISSSLDDVPVDLKSNRLILYNEFEDLSNQLKTALTRILVAKNA